ncbi:MAG: 5-(carboxyamino)imidazole ribonucleotide mutase [Spirochaetaceae bacterium]|jgi:5-(carboxyamino)imidazole ribonucleotide mutase|nr:5-(carboxyamino)imidazole ribonucleotide mutase [Spirochaetaceae bacterium]
MKVAIFFGSASDRDVMSPAAEVLREFGVEFRARVVSAHRAPALLAEEVALAEAAGAEVIIAGAGLAAHLPGVIASLTALPVIGVPLEGKPAGLGGMDALFSIVQMPRQIPVAAVGINNAANAAYLAVEILALSDNHLKEKLRFFRARLGADAQENREVTL